MKLSHVDRLLALALAVPSVVQVLVQPIASRPVGVLIALGSTIPIAWRTTYPAAAALAGSAVWLIPADGYLMLGYVAAFVLYYSLAAHVTSTRRVALVLGAGIAASIAGSAVQGAVLGEYFVAVSAVAAPALVGRIVRRQRRQAAQLADLAHQLDLERERGMRAAVAEERARIARELHDVVAHGLSVIAIQSDAAEAALDHDASLAREPLRTIRATSTEAMAEMRRLLGVLRADGAVADLDPQPGLVQLPALVERVSASGVPVTVEVRGEPRSMPASVDLSAYRIVQEALTNVGKHAAGATADVRLTWLPDALSLEVRDRGNGSANGSGSANGNGSANGSGHGLLGMRERVRMLGGELRTGPAPGGGFAVEARLPLEGAV
jgi:signal transduction histidine kinase